MKQTLLLFIASALVCLSVMSVAAMGWAIHMEKTIEPGHSVTIHCDYPIEPIDECDMLVVSPSIGGC